jgi:hypothetical protein
MESVRNLWRCRGGQGGARLTGVDQLPGVAGGFLDTERWKRGSAGVAVARARVLQRVRVQGVRGEAK